MGLQRLSHPRVTLSDAGSDREERRASPLLLGVAALLVVLIALVGLMIFVFTRPPPAPAVDAARLHLPSTAPAPSEELSRDRPAAVESRPAPEVAPTPTPGPQASETKPTGERPVEPARPPVRSARPVVGRALVLDTGTLRIGGETVRLRGVRGERGRAAEEMASYIRGRLVSCEPAVAEIHRCTVDGWDLSAVVLFNGGAQATPDAPADLRREESKARAARRGLWASR